MNLSVVIKECGGNCAILFKIQNEQLFEDDIDWLVNGTIPFQNTPLETSKYEMAKELVDLFPNELLESEKRTYGCPDCADQGGFYLALKEGDTENIWFIDTANNEQSQIIIDYKNKAWEIMQALQ